jgi:hypothetical protein
MAAAGLWTTASDLARAAIEVQREYAGTSHKILSQSMAREMLTHQKETWGLGFELEQTGHTPRFGHFGVNDGFVATLQAYRDMAQGIVIMTNGRQGEKLITEILRAVALEYGWNDFHPFERTLVGIDPTTLPSFTGKYSLPNPDGDDQLTVTARNNRLYLTGSYSVGSTYHFEIYEPAELLPEAPQQFFTLSTGLTTFRFDKNDKGTVENCVVIAGGSQRQAKKIP